MASVLRIPCHDDDIPFVLLHVDGSAGGSSSPLNLALVGTEGVAPYTFTMKQNKVASLRTRNGPFTVEEWATTLELILLGKKTSDKNAELLDGVETIASATKGEHIEIIIRKRIGEITQRIGAFKLSHDDDQEIELFQWCGIAVQSTSKSSNELASFTSKFREQQETIGKLNAQLEELIAAKANHEAELLEKFRDLLNEKKAKIRDQQRLLVTAKVGFNKPAALQALKKGDEKAPAGRSRRGKRKAGKVPQLDQDHDVEDDGLENMDVDTDQAPNDSDKRDNETPDEDETQTDDEEDDVQLRTKTPTMDTSQAGKAGKINATSGRSTDGKSGGSKGNQDQDMENDPPKTPPRRELPFTKKKKEKKEATPPIQVDEEETASEDDEL